MTELIVQYLIIVVLAVGFGFCCGIGLHSRFQKKEAYSDLQFIKDELQEVSAFSWESYKLLKTISGEFRTIKRREFEMSEELDALIVQVNETTTIEASVVVLLERIIGKLEVLIADLAAAGVDTAKLVELKDQLDASEQALAAAVANVPE